MNQITLCLAYYENPGMLRRQLDLLALLPEDLRQNVDLIVVDDGSPTKPARQVFEDYLPTHPVVRQLKLFRMGVDVPWNMDACRNLAASKAATDWILLTDIDHLVPAKTWQSILKAKLDRRHVYKFQRVSEPDFAPYKQHPNSWLMTVDTFDRAGGYDERFAGWYGTDGPFRDSIAKVAKTINLKDPIVRVPREVTPDASTTTLTRRSDENLANLDRIKLERSKIKGWRPLRNSFPWSQVL